MEKSKLYYQIRKTVSAIVPDSRILIFGSYARNEEVPNSDIDILVICNTESITFAQKTEIQYALYDLEIATSIIISPKIITLPEWNSKKHSSEFYENVVAEGIEI